MGIEIKFNTQQIIFGYLQKDINSDLINLIIMCAKKYIFQCAVNYKKVNIYNFQLKLKNSFYEQLTLLKLKVSNVNLVQKWNAWEPLFDNV